MYSNYKLLKWNKFKIYLLMKPTQLKSCSKLRKFFEKNPIKIHEEAQTPITKNKKFTLKYSSTKPVIPIEMAVVPITAICTIENNLPLNRFGTIL